MRNIWSVEMSFGVYLYPRVSLTDCICLCAAYFTNTKKKSGEKVQPNVVLGFVGFCNCSRGFIAFLLRSGIQFIFFLFRCSVFLFCVAASSAAACVLIPFKWSHLSTLSLDDGITRLFMCCAHNLAKY